jgi:RNA polymerase sigma-70 factor, ECF subfamily
LSAGGIIPACAPYALPPFADLVLSGPPDLTLAATPPAIDGDIVAARAGDDAAFARLYDRHVDALFAFCVSLTGHRQSATELVQDSFVRAWQALDTFRGDATFASWLMRIAVNSMLADRRATRRRSLRVAIDADLRQADGERAPLDDAAPAADPALHLDLSGAIARLPAGARAVFMLHDVSGYTHVEIAQSLGIAEGTSKAHLFRARRLLRGMLDR